MSELGIDIDEELLQEFHTEVSDIMEGLGDDFMTMEEQIDDLPSELIDKVFRGLHTIKGNAGFVGLDSMSKLAHAMEDIFSAVRNNTITIEASYMDHIFAGIDALKEMLADPMHSSSVDITILIDSYRTILEGNQPVIDEQSAEDEPITETLKEPLLESFLNSDDLIERIDLLQEMESKQLTQCIPALLEYIETPFADDPLNVILDSTIKELLKLKPEYIIEGLAHPGIKVQALCAQLTGKHQLKDASQALLKILDTSNDPELLRASLKSLGELQDPIALDDLREFAFNDDPVLAATAVSALGLTQPDFAILRPTFDRLPELPALAMLDGLATGQPAATITFLVDHIHHPNSVIRRVIANRIIAINEPAIDPLAQKLAKGNRDEKIMAANILGNLNQQRIFPYLIAVAKDTDENIRFAAYEALGNISSSQTCYTCYDGVYDQSLPIRTLALTYLEDNICAVATGKIRRNLQKNDSKAEKIREAMAHVAATKILGRLTDYPELFEPIFSQIKKYSSVIILEQYKSLLLQDKCKELLTIWNNISVETKKASDYKDQKVLIVDDLATVIRISTNILNKVGYITFTAMDGQQGLKVLEKHPVDIVITDMNMPVMTGIEMARKIRKNILFESLPLIMITTEQNENEKQAAKDAGIDIFLTKPFKPDELLECIESLLSK